MLNYPIMFLLLVPWIISNSQFSSFVHFDKNFFFLFRLMSRTTSRWPWISWSSEWFWRRSTQSTPTSFTSSKNSERRTKKDWWGFVCVCLYEIWDFKENISLSLIWSPFHFRWSSSSRLATFVSCSIRPSTVWGSQRSLFTRWSRSEKGLQLSRSSDPIRWEFGEKSQIGPVLKICLLFGKIHEAFVKAA